MDKMPWQYAILLPVAIVVLAALRIICVLLWKRLKG
jgi:hypothetical protein